jgi:serine protease inhibitor
MHPARTTCFYIAAVTLFITSSIAAAAVNANSASRVDNTFAVDLYRIVARDGGNVLLSPLSIYQALGMTLAGARGKTFRQMTKVMHLDGPSEATPWLCELGMEEAFSATADFSAMATDPGFRLSGGTHKAYIEIDEKGTDAAAATAGVVVPQSGLRGPAVNVDHPFIYLIRDNRSGAILFIGHHVKPDAAK